MNTTLFSMTHLKLQSAPVCNNSSTTPGNHWHSFLKSYLPKTVVGPHSTENSCPTVYNAIQQFPLHLGRLSLQDLHRSQASHLRLHTQERKVPPVQSNQLLFISQFSTDIDYINGSKNVVAKALSRVEAVSSSINCEDLTQTNDESLESFLKNSQYSLQLEKVTLPGSLTSIYCDTSTGKPSPFLTTPFQQNVFDMIYGLNHPGIKST